MKKIIVIVTVFITMSVFCKTNYCSSFEEVEFLIKQNLENNIFLISEKSIELTPEEKFILVTENQKGGTIGFGLNVFVGFGLGSFLQGDINCGILLAAGEIAGLLMDKKDDIIRIGPYFILVLRLFSGIRPYYYANKHNNKLYMSLYSSDMKVLDKDISINLLPEIREMNFNSINNNNVSYGLKLSINY
ncbi:MAG: hypothetical protein GX287_01830 [Fusobacteria bacterium]|nr:hypothetical protein [Fusobacteriota bacterium]